MITTTKFDECVKSKKAIALMILALLNGALLLSPANAQAKKLAAIEAGNCNVEALKNKLDSSSEPIFAQIVADNGQRYCEVVTLVDSGDGPRRRQVQKFPIN